MNTGNIALNKTQPILKHSFNPYMSPNISLFVAISVVLMMYAASAVFFGFPPLDENNPFDFIKQFKNMNVMNGLLAVLNVVVLMGLVLFVFLGAKDILEQRVVFDS
jgi:hypothetical protein